MIWPTPLRYRLVNSAAASVAILILYGTVAAVALQEPAPRATRLESPVPPKISPGVTAAPLLAPKASTSTVGHIAAPLLHIHVVHAPSVFQREQSMSYAQLMKRWEPLIKKAARRFTLPASWIREVMRIESGGRTMIAENARIVSSQGALGLMQIQPGTYAEMRAQYRLGPDPFDPHDNIFAGAAYLRWLRAKYGYPIMFEAYDDGPGNLEQRVTKGQVLPAETRNYVSAITLKLGGMAPGISPLAAPTTRVSTNFTAPPASQQIASPLTSATSCAFTLPSGSPFVVDCSQVTSIRAPQSGDSALQAQSIITIGKVDLGVRENEEVARELVRSHGGHV